MSIHRTTLLSAGPLGLIAGFGLVAHVAFLGADDRVVLGLGQARGDDHAGEGKQDVQTVPFHVSSLGLSGPATNVLGFPVAVPVRRHSDGKSSGCELVGERKNISPML